MPRSKKTPRGKLTLRSKFEASFFDALLKEGFNKKFLTECYESVKLPYTLEKVYKPDWNFGKFLIECKGRFTGTDRMKMLKARGNKDIRLVFMQDNYLSKKSNTKYSDWCEKNQFKYHVVGSTKEYIPLSWLKELRSK